jgi:hypothetical protein
MNFSHPWSRLPRCVFAVALFMTSSRRGQAAAPTTAPNHVEMPDQPAAPGVPVAPGTPEGSAPPSIPAQPTAQGAPIASPPSPTPLAASPLAVACVPSCRAGFVCTAQGRCVSSRPRPPVPFRRPKASYPGAYSHGGSYLRLGLGGGIVMASIKATGNSRSDFAGAAIPFEVAYGESPAAGLVLGVGFYGASMQGSHGGLFRAIGPFFDLYPDPTRGFHFQASIGYSSATASGIVVTTSDCLSGICTPKALPPGDYTGDGFGFMAGFGYEGWVGPEWSLGVLIRVQYFSAAVRSDDAAYPDANLSLSLPAFLLTATYH